jgi:hypothetical protein
LENKKEERKAGDKDMKGVKEGMNEIILPVVLSGHQVVVVVVVC